MSSQDCQEVEGLWCVAFSGSSELVVPSIIAVGLDVSGERERERQRATEREREKGGQGFRLQSLGYCYGSWFKLP